MPITLTIIADSAGDLRKQMNDILGGTSVLNSPLVIHVDEPKAETERRTRGPNKSKETASTPKPEPDAEQTADSQDTSADAPQGLNYETDIKPLVLEIAGRFGRDKVMEVLAKFGVTNAGHVPVEDQPALMEDIRLVLEG